ncbi:MAG: RNA polymerase sigma factor [Planctomycetota bacterium]|nr:RNA polymerase sigma factor [Planctomycetota bacterium]
MAEPRVEPQLGKQCSLSNTEHNHELTNCRLDIQFWYRRVYALCQSRLIAASDAEDATQETFVRAWSQFHELRSHDAIGGWLRQISHHVCVDMIRRQAVRATSPIDVDAIPDSGSDAAIHGDSREYIVRLVHALPETLREIILLHYYEEMTYDQMASWLGVARSTVNERLCKARQILKLQLKKEEAQ